DNVLGQEPLPAALTALLGQLADDRVTLLLLAVGAGLVVTLLDSGLHVAANYVNTRLEQGIVLDFRNQLFRHAQRLSVADTDQVSTGRLMYGINFEAAAAGGLIMAIQPIAQSMLTLVGIVWISLQIDVALAALALMVVPLLYYLIGYYATHIQQRLSNVKL